MSDALTLEALDRLEGLAKDRRRVQRNAAVIALIGRVQALEAQREDLRGRMERAREEIRRKAGETPLMGESTRLFGKAEGISLCLDYMRGME
ncbi:MAG: hypothetical protein HZY73_11190 [Micropruina sp.]|nr:MAG: hypothetical protein HZY73_11190 [Micropruina sp.]